MKPKEQPSAESFVENLTKTALYSLFPPSIIDHMVQSWTERRSSLFSPEDQEIALALQHFKDAAHDLSAEEKFEIVSCLYDGGTHNGAGFAWELMKWEVFWEHPLPP